MFAGDCGSHQTYLVVGSTKLRSESLADKILIDTSSFADDHRSTTRNRERGEASEPSWN